MREFLIEQGQERLPLVASARLEEQPTSIVQHMRRTFGFNAAREGKLLYSEAYQLTGLYGKTFESYASHIEMSSW